jgi:hypothetical protein
MNCGFFAMRVGIQILSNEENVTLRSSAIKHGCALKFDCSNFVLAINEYSCLAFVVLPKPG